MEINKKIHITLCPEDVKDAIIKNLYYSQGLSGIFNVKFKVMNKPIGVTYRDNIDHWEFQGADVIIDVNS